MQNLIIDRLYYKNCLYTVFDKHIWMLRHYRKCWGQYKVYCLHSMQYQWRTTYEWWHLTLLILLLLLGKEKKRQKLPKVCKISYKMKNVKFVSVKQSCYFMAVPGNTQASQTQPPWNSSIYSGWLSFIFNHFMQMVIILTFKFICCKTLSATVNQWITGVAFPVSSCSVCLW